MSNQSVLSQVINKTKQSYPSNIKQNPQNAYNANEIFEKRHYNVYSIPLLQCLVYLADELLSINYFLTFF